MKKSKMQQYLAGLLSTMYETDKHPETQLENAEHILNVLQQLGMKPPLERRCSVLLTSEHVWEKESD